MKKAIIVIIIILLAVGGWYFYSQQGGEDMNGEEEIEETDEAEENAESEDEEMEEDIPYYNEEESAVISGPNEEKHEILTEVFGTVFEESKLVSNDAEFDPSDPKFDYWGDMYYLVPDKIDADDAKEVQDGLGEEGFEIRSVDTRSDSHIYRYSFVMDGEEYDGRMEFFLGEGDISNDQGGIDVNFRIEN